MARSDGQDSNDPENPNLVHAVEYLGLVSWKSWRSGFPRDFHRPLLSTKNVWCPVQVGIYICIITGSRIYQLLTFQCPLRAKSGHLAKSSKPKHFSSHHLLAGSRAFAKRLCMCKDCKLQRHFAFPQRIICHASPKCLLNTSLVTARICKCNCS